MKGCARVQEIACARFSEQECSRARCGAIAHVVVGKVMLTALSLVFSALAPVWQIVLGVLLNAALLFCLFAFVYKLLFPKAKLKNLFRKRNLLALAIGSLALAVADALLRAYCAEYAPISIGIKIGVAASVLTLLCSRMFGKRAKVASAANAASNQ